MPTATNSARNVLIRYLLVFPLLVLIGFEVLMAGFSVHSLDVFNSWLASASAGMIHLFRGHVTVQQDVLMNSGTGDQMRLMNGCNGLYVSILLWAAMIAYPSSWRAKLLGLAGGSIAIHAVNVLRIVSLFYLLQFNRALFEFAHFYLWEALITLDALVAFAMWVRLTSPKPANAA